MATITVCGRNTASCRRFAAETNTRNSTIPRYRPCFPYRRSTSQSARAAADWSPDASPSGPARHKHVPRPFENKTTQHAHKSRKVNHFRVNRRSIAYVAHSVNIRHMQLENTLHIAGMQQNTLRIHLTENTTGTFILTPIGSYQSVPGDRGWTKWRQSPNRHYVFDVRLVANCTDQIQCQLNQLSPLTTRLRTSRHTT